MSRFQPIQEVVKSLCLRSGDMLQRNKGLYLDCAKDVYIDMNLSSMKIAVRQLIGINKRTNTIDMPCEFLKLCSVDVPDGCGGYWPVYRNPNLSDDIVDISAAKDCACEHKCGYDLCNTIKGYEAVQSVKSDYMPNGDPVDFNCVDRKAIDDAGFFYEQTQYPIREYISGVWTDTVLHTENRKLCQVEVDDNGCCCDSESNINAICSACGLEDTFICNSVNTNCSITDTCEWQTIAKLNWVKSQCGCYPAFTWFNTVYNISELGDRLIFPHNFGFDKVLVRYYVDVSLKNMMIPFLAKETFMKGLQYFSTTNNDSKIQLATIYSQQYSRLKFAYLIEMNKNRIKEFQMITTPPVLIPTFVPNYLRLFTL